jgi:hypothetical protein
MNNKILINSNNKIIKLDYPKGDLLEGSIENKPHLGTIQEKNFQKIKDILTPIGINFDYFWFGTFNFNDNNRKTTNFVIKSSCDRVYWRKYEGNNSGGCNNSIFINGNKIQLNYWLDSKDYINELI